MEGNAIIKSVFLGFESHGILTCSLILEQQNTSQSFGGWDLRAEGEAIRWIQGILKVLGVKEWNDLVGQVIRVKGDDENIEGIGDAIEDRWFLAEK